MNRSECFKIQLLEAEREFYAVDKMKTVSRILFDRSPRSKEPVSIVADPFLFVHEDTLYLFYEQKKLYHDGVIMMTCTKDLQNWTPPRTVLKEPFHLSFPYVFERDGNVYMIPETCANRSIRLYRAVNSELTDFVFVKKLLEMEDDSDVLISYSDSSILSKDDVIYLFTTVCRRGGANSLQLYYADDLLGPYREHCKSPVVVSSKHGRNAGSLILHEGEIYRPAQDCVRRYGDNVHLWKVTRLTPSEYREELFKESIYDARIPFYREGGHQLNVARFKGRYIVATDAKEYHWFWAARIAHMRNGLAEKIRWRMSIMDILYCDLDQGARWKELEDRKNQFELVRIGEDFSALEELKDAIGEEKLDILKRRASEEGCDVYVIRDDLGRSLGHCCRTIKDTWTRELQKDITVEEDAVYFFDDYISPAHRGRGAHRFSVLQRLEISKKEGFKRAKVAILFRNKRSMGNYKPFGFQARERLLIIKPFRRVISILDMKKQIGCSRRERNHDENRYRIGS